MRRVLSIVLILAAGCADPADDRLATGQAVVLYDPERDQVIGTVPQGEGMLGTSAASFAAGSRGTVVDDRSTDSLLRNVRVNMQEGGPYKGVASIRRDNLRPAP
jgi:hypothetical protein